MRPHVDHVLCILPFEVTELARLGGPPGTFVGHRLVHDPELAAARERQRRRPRPEPGAPATLLVLPGSRRSEVRALLGPFRETVELLRERGARLRLILPTVPHVERLVRDATAGWTQAPEIVSTRADKYRAFAEADAALAASGTVSLELALARVPTVVSYKSDMLMRMLYSMVKVWTASLPNLIADRPVVPEFYDHFIRPGMLARHAEMLMADTPARAAQLDGFDRVEAAMATERPAGEIAAQVVLRTITGRRKH